MTKAQNYQNIIQNLNKIKSNLKYNKILYKQYLTNTITDILVSKWWPFSYLDELSSVIRTILLCYMGLKWPMMLM